MENMKEKGTKRGSKVLINIRESDEGVDEKPKSERTQSKELPLL